MRYGLKTRCGIQRLQARPAWWCSAAAVMPWVGGKAQPVRQGLGPRGATRRQAERSPGPLGPDTLAKQIVTWHGRDLDAVCTGSMRALAPAGVCGATVTGSAEGPDRETTARARAGGPVTRKVRLADKPGRVPAIEVTV